MKKQPPQEWVCAKCNSKITTLTTLFGTWPITAYHDLSDIEKVAFWQTSADGQRGLIEAVESKIIFNQVKRLVDNNVGKFCPLEVWVRKGWSKEHVLKCPSEVHATTGEVTYQVAIHSTGTKNIQELVRKEMGKMLAQSKSKLVEKRAVPDPQPSPARGSADVDEVEPKAMLDFKERSRSRSESEAKKRSRHRSRSERTRSRHGSRSRFRKRRRSRSYHRRRRSLSDSRSCSRRRDQDRRRSKSKRKCRSLSPRFRKIHEVVQAKVEKLQVKKKQEEEKKRQRALTTECTKVVGKIGSLATDLGKLKKDRSYHMLPITMQEKHANILETLETYKKAANDRLTNLTSDDLEFTPKDGNDAFKQGTPRQTIWL